MKKKQIVKSSGDAGDYTVGQVSGSLFPEHLKPGALSALFSSSSSAKSLVFVPAPQLESRAAPSAPAPAQSAGSVHTQKKLKKLSAAEKKLQDRESALQNADDDGPAATRRHTHSHTHTRLEEEEEEPQAGKHRRKNTVEERLKLKRTVFVGNLPPSCSKKSLLALFRPAGVVESVRFRSVVREDPTISRKVAAIQRKVHPKKQNINAYVVFREEAAAAGALKWNGQEIQTGFHIRVDRVSKHSGHDHKRSIFVGNLPYDVSELPLREHFEECGTVEAVRLVRDRDSGMGKGFGYVLFESPDSVMLALKLNGSSFLERRIRVKRSVKKEKKKPPAGRPTDGKSAPERAREKRASKGPKHQFRNNMKNPGSKPTPASSFSGETANPDARRSRVLKKKQLKKSKPAVHI